MKKKQPRKFISNPKVITKEKSPSIFRSFTASKSLRFRLLPERETIIGFICGCLIVGIALSVVRLTQSLRSYQAVLLEKNELQKQRNYWQGVTKQFPEYRDAHFRLGVLAFQEGNMIVAKNEIGTALELDPSFVEGRLFLQRVNE